MLKNNIKWTPGKVHPKTERSATKHAKCTEIKKNQNSI